MRQELHDFLLDGDKSRVLASQWTKKDFRCEAEGHILLPGCWCEPFHLHALACLLKVDLAIVPGKPGQKINFFTRPKLQLGRSGGPCVCVCVCVCVLWACEFLG
jgi:hypothetical protein